MGQFSFKTAPRRQGVRIFKDGEGEPFENYRTLALVGPSIQVIRPRGPHTKPPKGSSLAEKHPQIASEWHPEWNNGIMPSEIRRSSNYLFYWKCSKGHQWVATLNSRTSKKEHGCPCCSKREVTAGNNLAALFPDHAEEWHPTKNGDLTPEDVAPTKHAEVFWRRREPPHDVWKARVSYRTSGAGTGGKGFRSKLKGSSVYESLIYWQMKYLYGNVKNRFRVAGREVDIAIPMHKIGIEYDSLFYHKNRAAKDLEKLNKIESAGWRVIRVRQRGLKKERPNDLVLGLKEQDHFRWKSIEQVVRRVAKIAGSNQRIKKYLIEKKLKNLVQFRKSVIHIRNVTLENSLLGKYPDVARYWDKAKNSPLTARDVSARDPSNYHFKCPVCGHEFESNPANMVRSRTSQSKGCLGCTGRLVTSENNLKRQYPDLVESSWDYQKNKQKPEELCDSSNQYAYWICRHCDKSRFRSINSVTFNQGKRKIRGYFVCNKCKAHEARVVGAIVLVPEAYRNHPLLQREWDKRLNGALKLESLTRNQAKKNLAWLCSNCGRGFRLMIARRMKNIRRGKHGCPKCRYERAMKSKAKTLLKKSKRERGDGKNLRTVSLKFP